MCLLLLAFHAGRDRPWLLLGNRDEFHARPTAAAQAWTDAPQVVGGRDLEAGGTWLTLNRNGRFAAVTNVRTGRPQRGPRSRGELVAGFVRGSVTPADYAAQIAATRADFGPFNLIVGDLQSAAGASSTMAQSWEFSVGVHVLSNGPPQTQWPKSRRLRAGFDALLQSGEIYGAWPGDAGLLDLLADTTPAADAELPDTGVGRDLERLLAPIFIRGREYGTRASTLAYARADGSCVLVERGFGPEGAALAETRIETQGL
ncbi:MAG TPA: NRDE family protein [Rudaea sp.]